MGNIPTPFPRFPLNGWTVDKKFFVCKTVSMSACIIGTAIYLSPIEAYLEIPIFGILVPAFITGYMLVHSSDIFLLLMGTEYVFLEMWFTVIGAIGSLICGVYQLQKWIFWVIDTSRDPDGDYNVSELTLSLAFLLQFASMSAVVYYRIRSVPTDRPIDEEYST